jgi:hypothetical protein
MFARPDLAAVTFLRLLPSTITTNSSPTTTTTALPASDSQLLPPTKKIKNNSPTASVTIFASALEANMAKAQATTAQKTAAVGNKTAQKTPAIGNKTAQKTPATDATAAPALASALAPAVAFRKKNKTQPPPYIPLPLPDRELHRLTWTAHCTLLQPLLHALFPAGLPDPATLPIAVAIFDDRSYQAWLQLAHDRHARTHDRTCWPLLAPCADTITPSQPFLLLHMRNDLDRLVGFSLVSQTPDAPSDAPSDAPPDAPSDAPPDAPGAEVTPIGYKDVVAPKSTGTNPAPGAFAPAHHHRWVKAIYLPRRLPPHDLHHLDLGHDLHYLDHGHDHDGHEHPDLHPLWAALDRFLFYGLGHYKRHSKIVLLNHELQHLAFQQHTHFLQHAFLQTLYL